MLGLILSVDAILASEHVGVLQFGLLDEPAHISTAAIALLGAVGLQRMFDHPEWTVWSFVFSMAIDIDHIPGIMGFSDSPHHGRPITHSLISPLVLGFIWLATDRRNAMVSGAATGVLLHFLRDIATGPGLPLLWPASRTHFRLPHRAYAGALGILALIATARASGKAIHLTTSAK